MRPATDTDADGMPLPSLKEDPLMNHKTLLDPLHAPSVRPLRSRAWDVKLAMGTPNDGNFGRETSNLFYGLTHLDGKKNLLSH